MTTLYTDARPEAERVQIDLLHRALAWRKLQMVDQLNQAARVYGPLGD